MVYILFASMGVFCGIVFSILFIRMDEEWKKITCFFGSNTGLVFFFKLIWILVDLENNKSNMGITMASTFSIYFIAFFISALIAFLLICSKLKKQDSTFKITFLDIIWGYKKVFDMYYKNKQDEIDKNLNYKELLKTKEELENRESAVVEKEEKLLELKKVIEGIIKEQPHIILPRDSSIPIDSSFIRLLPNYINNLTSYIQHLTQIAYDFIESESIGSKEKSLIIKAYFQALCSYTTIYLFESNYDNENVRTDIGVYNGKSYEWLDLIGDCNDKERINNNVNINTNIVMEAGRIKRSLLKSIYLSDIEEKSNDYWEDYLTIVFRNYCEGDIPIITMIISVGNKEKYKNLLYLVNYCKIERIIEKNMEIINSKYDIIEVLNDIRRGA